MTSLEKMLREALFAAREENYQAFHAKLIPNIAPETIIGVRMPQQRAIAKALKGHEEVNAYLLCHTHYYFEERNIHGFFIEFVKDYEACLVLCERFLPMVDNWATCDSFAPKVFAKHTDLFIPKCRNFLISEAPYTVRFGIVNLMRYALKENFDPVHLSEVARCSGDDYYVNMAVAWYFSMALVHQYELSLPWIEERRLPPWVHRKSIQKAIESRQVPEAHKSVLKKYRKT